MQGSPPPKMLQRAFELFDTFWEDLGDFGNSHPDPQGKNQKISGDLNQPPGRGWSSLYSRGTIFGNRRRIHCAATPVPSQPADGRACVGKERRGVRDPLLKKTGEGGDQFYVDHQHTFGWWRTQNRLVTPFCTNRRTRKLRSPHLEGPNL